MSVLPFFILNLGDTMNPYKEEKIQLTITEDDKILLDLLGVRHEEYSADDSSYYKVIVEENAISVLNSLTNEEAFDILDALAQAVYAKYSVGDSFINKIVEDILSKLSEQYSTTIETRIKNMVPMVTEELEKECKQNESEITKVLNIPMEVLHVID